MKRLVVVCLLMTCFMNGGSVLAQDLNESVNERIVLTEEQKQQLETLHKDMMKKRKEIIAKYVEFGVISEEKGEKMMIKLDEHYKKLKKNDFIPTWDKHKYQKYK